jgi:large subunit ribosomal protein L4
MAKVDVINVEGSKVGEINLSDAIFGIEPNEFAVQAVVKNYLANQRQGTQSAKTRSEVKGGGKKPYRQKGTGRARQGSRRAPNHVGGGIVFAPKPRSYRYPINKKVRRLATKSVLTSKVQENELIVIDDIKFEAPKTKEMVKMLAAVGAEKKALIVLPEVDTNVIKSASNIPGVDTTIVTALNVYDMLNHTSLILTQESANKIQEVYV